MLSSQQPTENPLDSPSGQQNPDILSEDETAEPLAFQWVSTAEAPKADIDAYVGQHPVATPYHRTAWLTTVEQAYGHSGFWLLATRGNQIKGILPLCRVKVPLRAPRLISLPYCDLGGPMADSSAVAGQLVREALKLMPLQAWGLELRQEQAPHLKDDDRKAGKVRMMRRMPDSSDELFNSFKPKLRSQIRKAEKNGLSASLTRDPLAVEAFYTVYSANMKRLGSPAHSIDWFRALQSHYGEHVIIGLVQKANIVVGAGLVLFNGRQACIPWASTLAEFNPLAPNMLLYWELLSHVSNEGYERFDFGRSTYGEGTYRFKKQWGAEPIALDWPTWLADGSRAPTSSGRLGRHLRPVIESAWRHLPLPVANGLGPRLRRYITL